MAEKSNKFFDDGEGLIIHKADGTKVVVGADGKKKKADESVSEKLTFAQYMGIEDNE